MKKLVIIHIAQQAHYEVRSQDKKLHAYTSLQETCAHDVRKLVTHFNMREHICKLVRLCMLANFGLVKISIILQICELL